MSALIENGIENFDGKTSAGEGSGGQVESRNVNARKHHYFGDGSKSFCLGPRVLGGSVRGHDRIDLRGGRWPKVRGWQRDGRTAS